MSRGSNSSSSSTKLPSPKSGVTRLSPPPAGRDEPFLGLAVGFCTPPRENRPWPRRGVGARKEGLPAVVLRFLAKVCSVVKVGGDDGLLPMPRTSVGLLESTPGAAVGDESGACGTTAG